MKASDIPDEAILSILRVNDPRWTLIWDLTEALPNFPEKVIRAKCRSLKRRGRIDGCDCGCRGDWELTDDQRARDLLALLAP